jgi:general stress protein YciG
MDAERQRQISAEGGRAAHRKGTAHEFDSEEAREAGRKGGQASGGSRRRRGAGGAATPESTENADATQGTTTSESAAGETQH